MSFLYKLNLPPGSLFLYMLGLVYVHHPPPVMSPSRSRMLRHCGRYLGWPQVSWPAHVHPDFFAERYVLLYICVTSQLFWIEAVALAWHANESPILGPSMSSCDNQRHLFNIYAMLQLCFFHVNSKLPQKELSGTKKPGSVESHLVKRYGCSHASNGTNCWVIISTRPGRQRNIRDHSWKYPTSYRDKFWQTNSGNTWMNCVTCRATSP